MLFILTFAFLQVIFCICKILEKYWSKMEYREKSQKLY